MTCGPNEVARRLPYLVGAAALALCLPGAFLVGCGDNLRMPPGTAPNGETPLVCPADGATWSPWQVTGSEVHHAGISVDLGPDVDGDEVPDVLVGAVFETNVSQLGGVDRVTLYSGATGAVVRSWPVLLRPSRGSVQLPDRLS